MIIFKVVAVTILIGVMIYLTFHELKKNEEEIEERLEDLFFYKKEAEKLFEEKYQTKKWFGTIRKPKGGIKDESR